MGSKGFGASRRRSVAARSRAAVQYARGRGIGISVPCAIDVAGCGLLAVSVAVVEIGTCGLLLDHAQDRGRVQSSAEQDDA